MSNFILVYSERIKLQVSYKFVHSWEPLRVLVGALTQQLAAV